VNNQSGGALRRRAEILRLIRERPVRSQGELQGLLRRRGIAAAQPTISRDVMDLGLARTPTGYAAPSEPSRFVPGDRRARALDWVLAEGVLSVQPAGTLVVVKTPAAGAHPVARAIDEAALAGVAGTIAGDDTVFVAATDQTAARRLARRFRTPLTRAARRTHPRRSTA
jgi:transcriptional regulator of arginine metabolism